MKAWEREVLEYRPRIELTTKIMAKIEKTAPATFEPTPVARQSAEFLATDSVSDLFTNLSRGHQMLETLKKCLSGNPIYAAYQQAKAEGRDIDAEDIHLTNVTDINGISQLDVIPLLEDTMDEMEDFLEFINRELFDGKEDFSDLEMTREREEKKLETIFQLEAQDRPVDYDDLMRRFRTILVVEERNITFRSILDQADGYLKMAVKDVVFDDVEGTIYHLASLPESQIPQMKTALVTAFQGDASQAVQSFLNMKRVGEREFRDMLNEQFSLKKQEYRSTYESLRSYYDADTMEDRTGENIFRGMINRGLDQIAGQFEQMTVEHITASILQRQQIDALFGLLREKKKSQLLYRLLATFADEFDPIDLDREVKRFIKHHRLMEEGTYCG